MNNITEGNETQKSLNAYERMELYLNHFYDFRYNLVSSRVEYKLKNDNTYIELSDYKQNSILCELRRGRIMVNIKNLIETLNSEFVPTFNPFEEYFNNLPKWNPEKPDYIKMLAETVTVEDSEKDVWDSYLKKWLIATVVCALKEKEINQTVLVFIGEQGVGKTTWMEKLVPQELLKYYFSGSINPNDKDTKVNLAECFLINLDELETLNRTEIGNIKQLITQSSIRIRRPYGRMQESMPRRASFMGSVNNPEFLKDDTGSRRFLCFEAKEINYKHEISIEDIYSQAMYILENNEFKFHFNHEEIAEINKRNLKYKVQQIELELVNQHFQPCLPNEKADKELSISDLQKYLKTKVGDKNDLNLRKLGIAMKASKYQRTKRDGVWYYKLKVVPK